MKIKYLVLLFLYPLLFFCQESGNSNQICGIAVCIPTSYATGDLGYTVSNVNFNGINKTTSSTLNGVYGDYACTDNTIVYSGSTYPLSVTINCLNSSPTAFGTSLLVYIDYNNDAYFTTPEERVLSGVTFPITTAVKSASVTIPATAVKNTMLRMRVIGAGNSIGADQLLCNVPYLIGDVEDYGVYIIDNLGTNENSTTALNYYPNPVKDSLNVDFTAESDGYEIFNTLGQKVVNDAITNKNFTIDCSNLSSGFYVIHFQKDNRILKKIKIIKI